MQKPTLLRVLVGSLVWGALIAGSLVVVHGAIHRSGLPQYPTDEVWTYLTTAPTRFHVVYPPGTPADRGDPVCIRKNGEVVTVGQIRAVKKEPERTVVLAEWFVAPPFPLTQDTRFLAIPNPTTPAWVIDVLLPPERKEALLEDLRGFAQDHHEEIFGTFWPPFEAFLREAFQILGDDLPDVLEHREEEVQKIVDRHKEVTLRKELMPILKEEVWPPIRERSAPLMEEVGQELWERIPMYQLGWRYVYSHLPFTDQEILRRRWNRFLDEEAIPILENHTEDFLEVVREVMVDLSRNPKLSTALKNCLTALVEDPEFIGLIRNVFTDLLSPQGRIFSAFRSAFSDAVFVDRLNRLIEALGPTLNRTANRIMLDETGTAINPDLARVLRTQILWKDACWILVESQPGASAPAGFAFRGEVYSWKGEKAQR
ncbi:MAG: hypothetical protein ACYTHN_05785 [Planctomycetota bacterium]|jgi:hypothetical protein